MGRGKVFEEEEDGSGMSVRSETMAEALAVKALERETVGCWRKAWERS